MLTAKRMYFSYKLSQHTVVMATVLLYEDLSYIHRSHINSKKLSLSCSQNDHGQMLSIKDIRASKVLTSQKRVDVLPHEKYH